MRRSWQNARPERDRQAELKLALGVAPFALLAIVLAAVMAALTSACLFALYVPALYTVLTSLSVQTMMLLRRRGGALPEAELYDRFARRKIMEQRLATLLGSGYVAPEGPFYRLTPRGRVIAKFFRLVKILWNLGPGG